MKKSEKLMVYSIVTLLIVVLLLVCYIFLGKKEVTIVDNKDVNDVLIDNLFAVDVQDVDKVTEKVQYLLENNSNLKMLSDDYDIDVRYEVIDSLDNPGYYDIVNFSFYFEDVLIGKSSIKLWSKRTLTDAVRNYLNKTFLSINDVSDLVNNDVYYVLDFNEEYLFAKEDNDYIYIYNKSFEVFDRFLVSKNTSFKHSDGNNLIDFIKKNNYYIDENGILSIYMNCSNEKVYVYRYSINSGKIISNVINEYSINDLVISGDTC